MFSRDDILEIYRSLPPDKQHQSGNGGQIPVLFHTTSGHHFVTAHGMHHGFERMVTTEAARIPVQAASSNLDVGIDVLLQLVRANPTLALLSQDGNSIIPKEERDAILKDLENMLVTKLVNKADFTQLCDLHSDSLRSLVRLQDVQEGLENDTEDYLLSKAYSTALLEQINQELRGRFGNNEIAKLRANDLLGTPPTWLVLQQLDTLASHGANEDDPLSKMHISQSAEMIVCTSKQSMSKQRDERVAELQLGHIFAMALHNYWKRFHDLYSSPETMKQHLEQSSAVLVPSSDDVSNLFAVSTRRLFQLADEAKHKVVKEGYFDLKTLDSVEIPSSIYDFVRDDITQKVMKKALEDGAKIRRCDDYLLNASLYDVLQQTLPSVAGTLAAFQWDSLKDAPERELKFQMTDVLAKIPQGEGTLLAVAKQRDSEIAAAEGFSSAISDLESTNEKEFSLFWMARVSQRVRNYSEGLAGIEETKLQEQLSELLANYLQKDLLSDTISKARSQGLLRSRRTRKNVSRFEATLKSSKSDLVSILETIEKFGQKQGLSQIGAEVAEAAKNASIQDMARRMQKPKTDAPSMFLSLVVILFAKQHGGMVYATGKFAPKLLKQMRGKLDDKTYAQVEKWKELAKAGTLGKEDRASMAQVAEEVA